VNIWRGHIYLAMAVVFVFGAALSGFLGFSADERWNGAAKLLLYAIGATCIIGALVTTALSYALWVPKWERDERRSGRFPGEERER